MLYVRRVEKLLHSDTGSLYLWQDQYMYMLPLLAASRLFETWIIFTSGYQAVNLVIAEQIFENSVPQEPREYERVLC